MGTATKQGIYKAMVGVMRDAKPIAKSQQGAGVPYKFRGIYDVYATLQQVLVKHKVFSVATDIQVLSFDRIGKGTHVRCLFTWRFVHEDGSYVETRSLGEGIDYSDKNSGKVMSTAHKYALLQAFCIPTDDPVDVENSQPSVDPVAALIADIAECDTEEALNATELTERIKKLRKGKKKVRDSWVARRAKLRESQTPAERLEKELAQPDDRGPDPLDLQPPVRPADASGCTCPDRFRNSENGHMATCPNYQGVG